VLLQSASLGPIENDPVLLNTQAEGVFEDPFGNKLVGTLRRVTPRFGNEQLTFIVARPQSEISGVIRQFGMVMGLVLTVLCLGQLIAARWLIQVALKPVNALRDEVAAIRDGAEANRGAQNWPEEIAPVIDELNALEADVERLVSRGRSQAADLAHTLKTPLAVLQQISDHVGDDHKDQMISQTRRIDGALTRHLTLVRTHTRGKSSISPKAIADEIRAALKGSMSARSLNMSINIDPDLKIIFDETDFYEILGNLMDNAVKWAKEQISVSAAMQGKTLQIDICDDGAGTHLENAQHIFERGVRLDELPNSQGLGLAIVKDLVGEFGGNVSLTLDGQITRARLLLPVQTFTA